MQNLGQRNWKSMLIDPFKQLKIGFYLFICTLFFILIAGGFFVKAFVDQYSHVMQIFEVVDSSIQWDLVTNDVFYKNALHLAIFFLVYLIFFFYIVFKMTHRYYGPLVSIQRFVKLLQEGNYQARVTIRNKDELQNLVEELNQLATILEEKHGRKPSP